MRRIVLGLIAVSLLGGLTGCRTMTTGVCDCDCLPPPVYPVPAKPAAPPAVSAPAEQIYAVPTTEAPPQLPNR